MCVCVCCEGLGVGIETVCRKWRFQAEPRWQTLCADFLCAERQAHACTLACTHTRMRLQQARLLVWRAVQPNERATAGGREGRRAGGQAGRRAGGGSSAESSTFPQSGDLTHGSHTFLSPAADRASALRERRERERGRFHPCCLQTIQSYGGQAACACVFALHV